MIKVTGGIYSMLIKELKTLNNKGLFDFIDGLDFYKTIPPDLANNLLYGFIGEKTCNNIVINNLHNRGVDEDGLKNIGALIWGLYADKWNKTYKTIITEIPLEDYSSTETEKIIDDGSTVGDINRALNETRQDDVTAYDSNDFLENQKTTNENTDTTKSNTKNDNVRTIERSKKGYINNRVGNINKYLDFLKKDFLLDIVFQDISNLLTLNIY